MKSFLQTNIAWPFCYQNELLDGAFLPQHNFCRRCSKQDCFKLDLNKVDYYECSHGFSCISFEFMKEKFLLNGLVHVPKNNNFRGARRKIYKQYMMDESKVSRLRSSLLGTEQIVLKEANVRVTDSIGFLHEIRTSVSVVLQWCQKIIDGQPGANFEEKINAVDINMSNLYKSIGLLSEQISLSDVIANPGTIKFGKKHRSKISPFIYKLVKLFEPRGNEKNCKIWMSKHIKAEIEAYNSFQLVPLILLDNAVKYSVRGHEILVELEEDVADVLLTVSSYGQIVPEEFRTKIFQKSFRGQNAEKYVNKGMGMGLYLAELIVKAHGATISYECVPGAGGEGKNIFIVRIKKVSG